MNFDPVFEQNMLDLYRPGEMSFADVRRARRHAAGSKDWQRLLALEDRRAFARDEVRGYTNEGGKSGDLWGSLRSIPAMIGLPVAEQAAKGSQAALEGLNEFYNGITSTDSDWGFHPSGRSGFFDPVANIAASWHGVGQGLSDLVKGWFE